MKYKALPVAIMLATANTYGLEGKIVNRDGNPIANATIHTAASKKDVLTNENGVLT